MTATAPASAFRPIPARAGGFARLLDRAEMALAGVVLVLLTGALVGPLLNPTQVTTESAVLRLMWPPVYAVVLLLALRRWRQLARFWAPAVLAFGLVAWALATRSWSLDPDTTGRRVLALFMTTLFGLYLGAAYPGRRLLVFLGVTFLVMAGLSLAFVFGYPAAGVHHDVNAGSWRGIWYEKNQLGAMMVIGALASLCAARTSAPGRLWWLAAAASCVAMMVMAKSATSLVCLVAALAIVGAMMLFGRGPASAVATVWAGGTTALAAGLALWLRPDTVLLLLGKDPTLTGRTGIWDAILRQVEKSPWLGYGYAAFWGLKSPPAMIVRKQTKWLVPSAHNGWLDLLVQVGLVGVALYAAVYVVAVLAGLIRSRRLREGDFSLLYLIVFGVVTLSESFILEQNNASWTLFVACLTRVLGPAPLTYPAAPATELRSASS